MRLLTLILVFLLMGVYAPAFSCEHEMSAAGETVIEHSHYQGRHKTTSSSEFAYAGHCCTGTGMVCCISVPNYLRVNKPAHSFCEDVFSSQSIYKSYSACTPQRPPNFLTV